MACGILQEATENVFVASTMALGDSGVTSEVTTVTGLGGASDNICFFGKAYGLEADLVSVLADPAGSNCAAGNGCGAHVHAGTSCLNSTTQQGHFYNKETLTADPWALTGYLKTDAEGNGFFADCVLTGETDFDGRAFVVHADDGSRVSCGVLLPPDVADGTDPKTGEPPSSAKQVASVASVFITLSTAAIAGMF